MTNRNILTFDDFKIFEQEKTKKVELPKEVHYSAKHQSLKPREVGLILNNEGLEIRYNMSSGEKFHTVSMVFNPKLKDYEDLGAKTVKGLTDFHGIASIHEIGNGPEQNIPFGTSLGALKNDPKLSGALLFEFFEKCGMAKYKRNKEYEFMNRFAKSLQWLKQEHDNTLPESFKDFETSINHISDPRNKKWFPNNTAETTPDDKIKDLFFNALNGEA